jgi:AcrR family transcriptional regulator
MTRTAMRRCEASTSLSRPIGASERLLDAVLEVAARNGYNQLTVQRLLEAAGLSRGTFYQYFTSVDDCFQHTYRRHAADLVREVAIAVQEDAHPELVMLDVLIDLASARPEVAELLLREGLAAGPAGLTERDKLISDIAAAVGSASAPPSDVDLPAGILIGAAFRYLTMRLADGEVRTGLRDDVRSWAQTFLRPAQGAAWSAMLMPELSGHARSFADVNTVPREASSRDRILHATALAVCARGYRNLTVANIVRAARVSRRLFYNEFSTKADAFIAAYEYGFQRAMAACAPAFFSPGAWPQRVWVSTAAVSSVFAREPSFAYLGFVESYSLGPRLAPRVHEMQLAFALFLEDGYRQRQKTHTLPRACSALTAAAVAEVGFEASRRDAGRHLSSRHPLTVFIVLTPFIGRDPAGRFVADRVSRQRRPRATDSTRVVGLGAAR